MPSFYVYYCIELLITALFIIGCIALTFIKHVKENEIRVNDGDPEKNASFFLILISIMLSMMVWATLYADYKLHSYNLSYFLKSKETSDSLNLNFRDREALILLQSDLSKNKNRYLLEDSKSLSDMDKKEYLMIKNLINHCFNRDISPDVYELFSYYPVSKLEAKEKIMNSLGKESAWISNPSCGTILSSSLIFIR